MNLISVTFKCDSAVKAQLARQAAKLGITISELVTVVVMDSDMVYPGKVVARDGRRLIDRDMFRTRTWNAIHAEFEDKDDPLEYLDQLEVFTEDYLRENEILGEVGAAEIKSVLNQYGLSLKEGTEA